MNKENFKEISEYLLQGKITLTTYRMFIETFEKMQQLSQERTHLEQLIIDELVRMEQGEFNQYKIK